MALEVIKPPLQPASQGAGGSYGNCALSNLMDNTFSAENCNPNMEKKVVTPKKTPVKSKTATLSEHGHDMMRSPVRRRLDCDENGNGKSPVKALQAAASPHKHFCRSPRCAANNPDYAVPAPRQYLKSKRHLLAGWQPPSNSKLKTPVRCEDSHHACDHEHAKQSQLIDGESFLAADDYQHLNSTQETPHTEPLNQQGSEEVVIENPDTEFLNQEGSEEAILHVEETLGTDQQGSEHVKELPVLSCEDVNGAGDLDTTILSTAEKGSDVAVNQEVLVRRADPTRASESDLSMRSIASDSRRETFGSSRPPARRGYFRRASRRFSISTASNQSISLHKQEGLKRKQAEDWMWDTAVKDAVQRLAPQLPVAGSVTVLVKAFESVKLTEEEILRAKYQNERLSETSNSHVTQMETMASITKVQAWDESMASADLIDDKASDDSGSLTPKSLTARIPQFSSKSEPPKVGSSRWAIGSDESMNGTKDDGCSDRGASSISGKSRITEWTCERKSQAGHTRKQKLKRCTSLHPFRLRTEERGAVKDYQFSKRLQQLWEEEQRLRIPLAQGLPWTTEEPAVPPKPLVKEQTKPEGFKLFTDVRAIERAEFDGYIAERNTQMELQKQEEERQRQIAEEEEVKRLRREMVPRAQLMPYFDRPFMPRRSSKKLTVPREPKFHLKQHKRPRCMASCNSIAA